MALTQENLTGVEGLTPEQVAQIVNLSAKDSEQVAKAAAGEATRAAYGFVDDALKAITGKEKPGGVKTTDHLESTLSKLKSSTESSNAKALKEQLDDVTAKYEALQKEKATPGDVSRITNLERDLTESQKRLEALQAKYTEAEQAWQAKNEAALTENENIRASAIIDGALDKFTYRDDLSENIVEIVRENAREKIMKMPRKWVDGKMVFVDETGLPINNPTTITPASADYLLGQQLGDVIVQGKKATGAGSGQGGNSGGSAASGFSLEGATSKESASRMLSDFITKEKGLSPGTKAWQDEFDKIFRETVHVADLPTKEEVAV